MQHIAAHDLLKSDRVDRVTFPYC